MRFLSQRFPSRTRAGAALSRGTRQTRGCCLALPLAAAVFFLHPGTAHGDDLCGSNTWTSSTTVGRTLVVGGTSCPSSPPNVLTITPGVQVTFLAGRYLDVANGTLIARGNAQNHIIFTAASTTTGNWNGIRFENTSKPATFDNTTGAYTGGSILEYVDVQYANDSGSMLGVVALNGAAPYLHELTVEQSTFQYAAIGIATGPQVVVDHAHVHSASGAYGISTLSPTEILVPDISASSLSTAIYATPSAGALLITSASITSNSIANYGIYATSSGSITIDAPLLTQNSGLAYAIYAQGALAIDGAIINGNGAGTTGVYTYFSSGTVSHSIITGGSTGIYAIGYGAALAVKDNDISSTTSAAIRAQNNYCTSPLSVTNNLLYGNDGSGLVVVGCSSTPLTVTGNCISANGTAAVPAIDVAGPVQMQGNTFIANVGNITLEASASTPIANNNLYPLSTTIPCQAITGAVNPGACLVEDKVGSGSSIDVDSNYWGGSPYVTDSVIHGEIDDCGVDGSLGCVNQIQVVASGPIASAPDPAACQAGATGMTTTTTTTATTTSTPTTSTTATTTSTTATTTRTTSTSTTATTSTTSTSTTATAASSSTTTSTPLTTSTTRTASTTTTTASTSPATTTTSTTTTEPGSTETTTSSMSTTTSTNPCGNGRLDPGEECDPGTPGSPASYCCTRSCLVNPFQIGKACGAVRTLDACELPDACDSQGRCAKQVQPSTVNCRPAFANDNPCDAGDNCDGVNPSCPTTNLHDCTGAPEQPPAGTHTVTVTCTAPATVSGKPHRCTAQGFGTTYAPATRSVNASDAHQTCNGKPVTNAVTEPLKQTANTAFLQRKLSLTLNRNGRRYLNQHGSLNMCVLVTVRFRGAILSQMVQTVTVSR